MKMHKKGLTAVFLAAVAVVAFSSTGWAALYGGYTETSTGYSNDGTTSGQQIESASFGQDLSNYYFKMVLVGTPSLTVSSTDLTKNYASHYGIFIDTYGGTPVIDPTGSDGGDTISLGVGARRTKFGSTYSLVFTPLGEQWVDEESIGLGNMGYEKSGNIIEWSIPKTDIGSDFSWLAATVQLPYIDVLSQTDSVNATATPIPNAAWLLGSGIIGLIGLKRRQAKRQ